MVPTGTNTQDLAVIATASPPLEVSAIEVEDDGDFFGISAAAGCEIIVVARTLNQLSYLPEWPPANHRDWDRDRPRRRLSS
jgi:hypothetical protein